MSNYNTRYDFESDCLTVKESGKKIKKSLSLGNITLDFDSQGKVIGAQVLNASDVVIVLDDDISAEELLQNIETASVETQYFEDGILVNIKLSMEENDSKGDAIISSSSPAVSA